MKNFFALFKAVDHIEPIQDPEEIKKEYKYWRFRIFYSMFFGYTFYYFTRKSFTFAMPALMESLAFTKSDLGIVSTVLALSYGLSKFLSGILADRSNPRYFMAIGLMMTGILNICFGLSSSLIFFAIFWGLNGLFQGFGWPPCTRLLTHWYSQKERGSWWSYLNVSHNAGGFIIPILAASLAYYFGWRFALFIPGVVCIAASLFLINRLRDTPQSLGLPPIEEYRNDYSGVVVQASHNKLSTKQILVEYVLKNKFIWLLSFSYFFVYIIRQGVTDWGTFFLKEYKGYSIIAASGCVALIDIGGLFGNLAAGWSSDKIFNGKRGPVNVLFSISLMTFIGLFWFIPNGYSFFDSACMFMIGFSVFGPQMMIGMAAAELVPKNAAATASGFAGWFAYLGAASAGYPIGKIIQEFGWDGYFTALIACCIVALVALIPMWSLQAKAKTPSFAKEAPKLESDVEPQPA